LKKLNNNTPISRRKHVPVRTCVACRCANSKRELIRLVKTSEGVVVDARGKLPGRGVYLCPDRSCWEKGLKGNRIEFGLRIRLSPENRQALLDFSRNLSDRDNRK